MNFQLGKRDGSDNDIFNGGVEIRKRFFIDAIEPSAFAILSTTRSKNVASVLAKACLNHHPKL